MKYIYSLLVLLIIISNSLSNEPSRDHLRHAEKMRILNEQRDRQNRIIQERKIRNVERQMIYDRLGINIIIAP